MCITFKLCQFLHCIVGSAYYFVWYFPNKVIVFQDLEGCLQKKRRNWLLQLPCTQLEAKFLKQKLLYCWLSTSWNHTELSTSHITIESNADISLALCETAEQENIISSSKLKDVVVLREQNVKF